MKDLFTITVNPEETVDPFPWEEFVDSISAVPFETSKESVFSNIHQLIFNRSKFYFFDVQMNEIFVFKEDGSFEKSLNLRGRGPGQYNVIKDFHFDDENNAVILDYKKIHKYDANFRYLYSIDIEDYGNVLNLCYFDDSHYYTFNQPIDYIKDDYLITQKNGKSEIKYIKNNLNVLGRERFIKHKKNFYMIPPKFQNYIYEVTPDSIFVKFKIDFKGKFVPIGSLLDHSSVNQQEDAKNLYEGYVSKISNFYELSNYIYFQYVFQNRIYQAVYNKNTGEVFNGVKYQLYDKIPIFINGYSESNNCLFATLEPYILMNIKFSEEFFKEHSDLAFLRDVKESDNPILFKLFLK